MKNPKNYADLTKYPGIYSHFYWGDCKGDLQSRVSYAKPEIIENRNKFIEEHKIRRHWKMTQSFYANFWRNINSRGYCREFDHAEFFITETDTIIILVSPYGNAEQPILKHPILKEYEFTETYELYGNGARSFYLEMPNKFNKTYLDTKSVERYFGKSIFELKIEKKALSYWVRVMEYEQSVLIKGCIPVFDPRPEYDCFVRDPDYIWEYMMFMLDDEGTSYATKEDGMKCKNLWEFRSFLWKIRTSPRNPM